MSDNITVSVYHDTRQKRKSNLYPVFLVVYYEGVQKFYPCYMDNQRLKLSPEDFKSSYPAIKPKGKHKEIKEAITANEVRAKGIIKDLNPFSFDEFKLLYTGKSDSKDDLVSMYNKIIAQKNTEEDFGTASSYQCSINSLLGYRSHRKGKKVTSIKIKDITVSFLKDYENYMLKEVVKDGEEVIKKRMSPATVGIYLRPLRAIIKEAINKKLYNANEYPFVKGKYVIPSGTGKALKSLNKEQVKQLYEYDLTGNDRAIEARAYWFFSYAGNGMNVKDIVHLKYDSFTNDSFSFIRSKTKKTSKANTVKVVVPLTDFVKEIIKRYGNDNLSPDTYVFPFLNDDMTGIEQHRKVKNVTRFINQHLRPVAIALNFPANFSTYYARHSFATIAVHNGATTEYIQDALGHLSSNTTRFYIGRFSTKDKHKINSELTDFLGND